MKKYLVQFEDTEHTRWFFEEDEILRLLYQALEDFPGKVTMGPIPRLTIVQEEKGGGQ